MHSEDIIKRFKSHFDKSPLAVRSPGRVNLIGEHTDYNLGFVMPAAIDKQIICALAPNYGDRVRLVSHDLNESFEFDVDHFNPSDKGWPNYIMGVVDQYRKKGLNIKGFDCVFGGDIPLGAGLSSSAALECAFAYALNSIFDHRLPKLELVKLAQLAENEFVGVQCGIMDQFASIYGKTDKALKLDCRSLEFEYFNLEMDHYRIVLCDTQVKHSLASSEYNTRRKECETGVAILQEFYPGVKSLRDTTLEQLSEHQNIFDPIIYRRCRFVVEENNRVLDAGRKLTEGNIEDFGKDMYASHKGLSEDYEVSCRELDFLFEHARQHAAVIGARMMGGGFGGCTINLVKIDQLGEFTASIADAYGKTFGVNLKSYVVKIGNGTGKI